MRNIFFVVVLFCDAVRAGSSGEGLVNVQPTTINSAIVTCNTLVLRQSFHIFATSLLRLPPRNGDGFSHARTHTDPNVETRENKISRSQ